MQTSSPAPQFEMVTLKSGIKSLRSLRHRETFHPTTGPWGEATSLHSEQQRLLERAEKTLQFIIWDVGLGAAANALSAIDTLKNCIVPVEIHSFDQTTAPLEYALAHAQELEYLLGYEDMIQTLIRYGFVRISPTVTWRLHLGDFSEWIQMSQKDVPAPHAILFDPYSAATNPEMWTLQHFQDLFQKLDPQTPCLLTNYTRSTAVRVSLLLAGFSVGIGCIVGEKAETTLASNHLSLLEHPLDKEWLKRVINSDNSAPLREATYSKSKISAEDLEALKKLPQFTPAG